MLSKTKTNGISAVMCCCMSLIVIAESRSFFAKKNETASSVLQSGIVFESCSMVASELSERRANSVLYCLSEFFRSFAEKTSSSRDICKNSSA